MIPPIFQYKPIWCYFLSLQGFVFLTCDRTASVAFRATARLHVVREMLRLLRGVDAADVGLPGCDHCREAGGGAEGHQHHLKGRGIRDGGQAPSISC